MLRTSATFPSTFPGRPIRRFVRRLGQLHFEAQNQNQVMLLRASGTMAEQPVMETECLRTLQQTR